MGQGWRKTQELIKTYKLDIPENIQKDIRENLLHIFEHEKVDENEAKNLMDQTYGDV